MSLTEYVIDDVITLVRRPVVIDPSHTYEEIGVRSFGRGIFHKPPVSGTELGNKKVFEIHPGELVFNTVFAWEGAVAVTSEAEHRKIGSHRFMTYQVNPELADIHYLCYFFQSEPGLKIVAEASPGGAGRNRTLGIRAFARQRIALPELAEQRRIASRVSASLAHMNTVWSEIDRLEKIRVGMVGSFFSSHRWLTTPAGDVLTPARTPIAIDQGEKYRAIGIKSFGRGLIRYAPQLGSDLSKLRYFTFPANALAISNIKAWEGAVAVTTDDASDHVASNRFLFYVPSNGQVDVRFVRYYLLSHEGLYQLNQASPGSADRNRTLSVKSFEHVNVPVPDIQVQHKIADALDMVTVHLDAHVQRRVELLRALKPSLLNAAFSGQL